MSVAPRAAEPIAGIRHLDYVILLCDDTAAMRRFYTVTSNWPFESHRPRSMSAMTGC